MLRSGLLLTVSLLNLLSGIFVLSNGTRKALNRHFFYLAAAVAGWAGGLGLYYIANSPELVYWSIKIFYLSAIAISHIVLLMAIDRANKMNSLHKIIIFFVFISISLPIIIVKDFLVVYAEQLVNGTYYSLDHLGYLLYSLVFLIEYFMAVWLMAKKRIASTDSLLRQQLDYMLLALVTAAIFGIIFNLVLPWFDNFAFIWVGPMFSIVFLAFIGIGIGKASLFDIRKTVARATAYTFSLSLIILVYGGFAYVIGEKIFSSNQANTTVVRFIYTIFAVITAAIFTPLKRFFDKATNFIFYRDAYDSQDLLNEFNQLLAVTADVDTLLGSAARIIQKHLKSEYVVFGLRETERMPRRLVGTIKKSYKEEDLSELRRLTVHMSNSIIIRELLDKNDSAQAGISKILKKYSIELLARLVDRRDTKQQSSGYLLLGPKKSGNKYTSQDAEVFEIIVNEMVLAIQNALRFEEIEQFNETLQEKIFTATRELKQSNDKLRALDQAKDEFVSMASHQLRTPLTSVKGYLSMLAEGDAGKLNPTQQQFVEQSFASSQRMVYLISDLLNVSRLKTGKFVIEKIPTNLAKLIDEELSQLKGAFDAKHLKLATSLPEDFPTIELDETKIRQVVMNFVDNAIYYTPDGGNVDIKLAVTNKKIEFTVTDSGIGVPKHVQHHLFTKFYRADNARKMRPDGTGIGLFMAKKVITAQGGSIIFRSSEGKGSTFGFSFPVV